MDNFKSKIKFLIDLIKKSEEPPIINSQSELQLTFDYIDLIISEINAFNDNLDVKFIIRKESNNKININITNNKFKVFYKKDNFFKTFNLSNIQNNFGVIVEDNSFFLYNSQDNVVFDCNGFANYSNFITNSICYLNFRNTLRDDKRKDPFCIYNDSVHFNIVSILPEKGKFEIGYSDYIPDIPDNINFYDCYIKFDLDIGKKGFMPFFKREVYDNLKQIEQKERLYNLVLNLALILENSENNFDIYLNEYSVKNLLDELRSEKEKYYSMIRDIINKIYSYSISVPLSITAVLLGMINLKERDPFYIILILVSFLIFSAISIYYQFYLLNDLKLLRKDFKDDKDYLKENSLYDKIKIGNIISSIEKKLNNAELIIKIIIAIVSLMTILVLTTSIYILFNDFFITPLKLFGIILNVYC